MVGTGGSEPGVSRVSAVRIAIKTAVLFGFLNAVFALFNLYPSFAKLSAYNSIVPGRLRFPYGEDPDRSYNLTINQVDAMLAAHEIDGGTKDPQEYRVIIIGDSSTWGFLLHPHETVAARISDGFHVLPDGRRIRAYNFGFPTMSLLKDLVFLKQSLRFEPDLILWLFTLESFPLEGQLDSPLVQYNPDIVRELIAGYDLELDPMDARFVEQDFWARTIVSRRKDLADLVRLQLYGAIWSSTAVDRHIPETYNRVMEDLPADERFHGWYPGELTRDQLAFDILAGGIRAAGEIPVVLVNEPVYISSGRNSDIRYNFYYPRWAYDDFRTWLRIAAEEEGWEYLDLWQTIQPDAFTDSAIHYDARAAERLSEILSAALLERIENSSHPDISP